MLLTSYDKPEALFQLVYLTLLQLLGFSKMRDYFSHFRGIFRVFVTYGWQFDVIIDNLAPLSYRNFDGLTFLQRSHIYFSKCRLKGKVNLLIRSLIQPR